jgi:hypothetical protein
MLAKIRASKVTRPFPYLLGILSAFLALLAMNYIQRTYFDPLLATSTTLDCHSSSELNASELSRAIDHRWPFFLAVGATLDAFAFVLFTPVSTMRRWHNTVVSLD